MIMIGEVPDSKEVDLSAVKYVISDWDGTLVDSLSAYLECFLKVMEDVGGDSGKLRNYYLSSQGRALSQQIKDAAKSFAGKDIEDTKDYEAKFFDFYVQMGEIEVLGGASDTLKYLKEKGFNVVVWSGARTDILGKKLEQTGLGRFVDFYIGNVPGDDKLVKGPGLFGEIAKHFGLDTEQLRQESIVVGDGIGDIEAGKKSGAKTVGLGVNGDKLKEAGADFVIKDISELVVLLRKS